MNDFKILYSLKSRVKPFKGLYISSGDFDFVPGGDVLQRNIIPLVFHLICVRICALYIGVEVFND